MFHLEKTNTGFHIVKIYPADLWRAPVAVIEEKILNPKLGLFFKELQIPGMLRYGRYGLTSGEEDSLVWVLEITVAQLSADA